MGLRFRGMKQDSGEGLNYRNQLEHIASEVYRAEYAEYKARLLIPPDTSVPAGASEVTYLIYSAVGMAKVVAGAARDIPRVDVFATPVKATVRTLAAAYGYTFDELDQAAHTNMNPSAEKGLAAKEGILAGENEVAWRGDSRYNLTGFIMHPNASRGKVADAREGNTGPNKFRWEDKTPQQILYDLNQALINMRDVSRDREIPDTLLLPIKQYGILQSTRMSDHTDTTIMKFFRDNNPNITLIDTLPELQGAHYVDGQSHDVFALYKRDPSKLKLVIPLDFEQLEPTRQGLEYEVVCRSKTAGVVLIKPLSVYFGWGI